MEGERESKGPSGSSHGNTDVDCKQCALGGRGGAERVGWRKWEKKRGKGRYSPPIQGRPRSGGPAPRRRATRGHEGESSGVSAQVAACKSLNADRRTSSDDRCQDCPPYPPAGRRFSLTLTYTPGTRAEESGVVLGARKLWRGQSRDAARYSRSRYSPCDASFLGAGEREEAPVGIAYIISVYRRNGSDIQGTATTSYVRIYVRVLRPFKTNCDLGLFGTGPQWRPRASRMRRGPSSP
ncbi:hypothetical protein KM043_015031 [Ampulex compressa]|nr:hypothetical protein KM043_015031 [Ampulex compressa]